MIKFDYLQITKEKIIQLCLIEFPTLKDLNMNSITVDFPGDIKHGDLTTNIAMILAKHLKKAPQEIAQTLLEIFKYNIEEIENLEIAGNGFINFKLKKNKWLEIMQNILQAQENYGANNIGQNQKVNLEFCSANPTGPVHLGHIRGAVYGDVMAKILKFCGFQIDKEYYVNDAGGQIENLLKSAFLRYQELFGKEVEITAGLYPGLYLVDVAQELKVKYGDQLLNNDWEANHKIIYRFVIDAIMNLIKNDLALLGITYDIFTYESNIVNSNLLNETLEILKEKNLIYNGILEKPKGEANEDWEEREQLLFRSTEFGDDMDRAMQRSSGEWTYFSKDLAYHLDKIKRNYNWLILEVGIDHNGYKKRLSAGIKALNPLQKFSFEFHNMVYLKQDGVQLKMSKRSGNLVGASEILNMLDIGVLRFYLLSKKHDMILDFDIEKATEASKDNPYFYIQYAYARSCSILRNAAASSDLEIKLSEYDQIEINEGEKTLIKKLCEWPTCVVIAAQKLEPHRINFYLQELAANFHNLWNLGNNDVALRFINENDKLMTKFRINLVKATILVIANGLGLLGVKPLEKM